MPGPQKKDTTETATATPQNEKLYPVKLVRNYRPIGEFKVLELLDGEDPNSGWEERKPDGEFEVLDDKGKITQVASGERWKVTAGSRLMLNKDEARNLLKIGVAERHDDL